MGAMHRFSFYALVLFFFSLPWQDIVALPGGTTFSVARIVGLFLIAAAVVATLSRGSVRLRVPALTLILTWLFCAWVALSGVGSLWSPTGAFVKTTTYVQLAVMATIIWQLCRTEQQHVALLQAFVIGAYVIAGRLVYDFATNPFVPNAAQSFERYVGLGGNPNGVAAIMALALPMAYFLGAFRSRGGWRWLNLLYLPLAVFGIILTASRGGFLIALTGLLVVPLTAGYLRRSGRVAVVIGAVAVVAGLAPFVPAANFSRIAETSSEVSEGNVSNRSQIWAGGLKLYQTSPLIGVGTGSFSRAIEPVLGYSIAAHNAFLIVLIETGVVGFALFVLNFVIVLAPLLGLPGPERLFYGCLWLALVVSMLPSNVEDAQYVWALLTLMATRRAYTARLAGLPRVSEPDRPALPAAAR